MDDGVIIVDPKAGRARNAKWIVPLILLVLVLVLVTIVALSNRLQMGSNGTDIVLYSLTGLLCTLVAVSLTLTGCREYLSAMSDQVDQVAATMVAMQNEQMQLHEVIHSGNQELRDRCAGLEETQRLVQEGISGLKDVAQTTVSCVKTVGEEQENLRDTVANVIHEESRQLADQVATFGTGTAQLDSALTGLRELTRTVADNVADIASEQTSLGRTQQSSVSILGDIAEQISGIAGENGSLAEQLEAYRATVDAEVSALAARQQQFDTNVDTIKVLTQTAASSITNIADEQAALHKVLRDTSEVLTDSVRAAEAYQQALRHEVNKVAETGQQTRATATTMAAEQAALHETVKTTAEELSSQVATLSENQQILQRGVDYLSERTDDVVKEVDRLSTQQAGVDETLHAKAVEVMTTLSAITAGQGQIGSDIDGLRSLGESVVGNVACIAEDHASLHSALQANSQELADGVAGVRKDVNALQAEIECLTDKGDHLIAGQNTVHAALTAKSEELAGKMTALLESQLSFHAGVSNLNENANHVAKKVEGVAAEQNVLSEVLRAHTETVSSQMSALAACCGQLDASVSGLRELTETVAGNVSSMAAEQAEVHSTVEKNAEALTDGRAATGKNQQEIRAELDKIAETGRQVAVGVKAMASQLTTAHDLLTTNGKEWAGQLAALVESQRTLHNGMKGLNDKTNDVVAEVAVVASGQASLSEALEAHSETVNYQVSGVAAGCEEIGAHVEGLNKLGRAIADHVTNVAREQAELRKTLEENATVLTDSIVTIGSIRDTLEADFREAAENGEQNASRLEALVEAQEALQEAVNTCNEHLTGQISALAENQQSLRVEVSKAAETGERTGTTVSAMAATQDALHRMIAASDAELVDQLAVAVQNQDKMQSALGELRGESHTVAGRIEAVVEAQSTLDETLHQATDQLAGRLMTLTSNHGQLHSNVNSLREVAQKVARHVVTIGEGMENLRGTLEDNNQLLTRGTATAEEKMDILGSEVKRVAEASQQTGATVNLMASEQMAMAKAADGCREDLTRQIAVLSEDQRAGIDELKIVTAEVKKMAGVSQQTGATVNLMASEQMAMAKAADGCREDLTRQIAVLSEDQRAGIDELKIVTAEVKKMAEVSQQTGATVNAVASKQIAVARAVDGSREDLTKKIAVLSEDQRAGIEELKAITAEVTKIAEVSEQTDVTVNAVAREQTDMARAMDSTRAYLMQQIPVLSDNQQAGLEDLKSVSAEVRKVAEDNRQTAATVNLMASEQMATNKAVDSSREDLAKHVALLSKNQQAGVDELKAVTAEVKKVAEASRQAGATVSAMAKALNVNREDLAKQISSLLGSQQSGIEELKTIAGETASNLLLVDGKQAKLEQVFQTHREKLISALTAIAQGQQEWLQRLDLAREKTNEVLESFHALEQRIDQLQDNSQANNQELAELLSAQGQLRMEFETRIGQGLETITASIADIVEARGSLQDQLEEVKEEVRPHTEGIAWAIEKLKQRTAATDDPPSTV